MSDDEEPFVTPCSKIGFKCKCHKDTCNENKICRCSEEGKCCMKGKPVKPWEFLRTEKRLDSFDE